MIFFKVYRYMGWALKMCSNEIKPYGLLKSVIILRVLLLLPRFVLAEKHQKYVT